MEIYRKVLRVTKICTIILEGMVITTHPRRQVRKYGEWVKNVFNHEPIFVQKIHKTIR